MSRTVESSRCQTSFMISSSWGVRVVCFGRIVEIFIVLMNSYVKGKTPIRRLAFPGRLLRRGGLLGDDAGVDDGADAGESLKIHVGAGDFDEHESAVGVETFVGDGG